MIVDPRASTHRIEEVGYGLIRKDLCATARLQPISVRPAFVENSAREPAAYSKVLTRLGIGPRCFRTGRDWLIVERVDAPELWQIGELSTWVAVARWVAVMHRRLADADTTDVPLLVHDGELFEAWRLRAARRGAADAVLAAHERATACLLALPSIVLHGDLYPSNLLVQPGSPVRIWPVDWELMGRGPAVLDLAALTSGRWAPGAREAMVRAYVEAAPHPESAGGWRRALDAARLHLCVQWLGMPAEWVPPALHVHDWATEALALADGMMR